MDLICENGIYLNENLNTKDEVLKKLSEIAVREGIAQDSKVLYDAFLEREKISSTGMMDGFSIPHAKSDTINKAQILVIRNNKGISDWETLDNLEVNLVIAILVPNENVNEIHLKVLSNVSRKLMSDENVKLLKSTESKKDIIRILS
ncbi:PTS sugar transporter subunit IIA [Anaerococcus lactolyticus]|uniref:PTS sugar transporter subunit IIA n=1 Tax=Anaerococcus lactolyticus TaxID=33032 RepID=UPI00288C5670|nr:fructose PTS transporter subunit IIA [Anaerococcus lactolyticus]